MKLRLSKELFAPHFYPLLRDYSHRWEIYNGSAGSGKSYFITQKLIIRALEENIKILVCRRYGTTIKDTVFSLFREILMRFKISDYVKIIESSYRIKFPNGSEIIFKGLDEETKLLSLNNISTIWIEEAFEVPEDMIEQLNLRMRGQNEHQQILLSFNPISKNHWLYQWWNNPRDDMFLDHSTYRDNPFLSEEYVKSLEELRMRNPAKAKIFCDGEFGVNNDLLVFRNFHVMDFDPQEISQGKELKTGLDFGFVDPTAIACSLYDRANKRIYVYDEWFSQGAQLDDIAAAIRNLRQQKIPIFCDSAEPRSIDFLKRQGINAKPCIKGPDSVNARISFLQNHEIILRPCCKNLIAEFENFCFEKDRDGNITDNTTHEWSHGIDALGYAYSDIYRGSKLKTLDKSVLGL